MQETYEIDQKYNGLIKNGVYFFQNVWAGILGFSEIEGETDFFKSGAGSMDVVRYGHLSQ